MRNTVGFPLLAAAALLAFPVRGETVRVQTGGRIVEMDLERYVAGILAGETSVFRSEEALKAMAVAARTYALHFQGRHADEGFDLCDTTHCQRLDLSAVTERLTAAVEATRGEIVLYRGKPAATFYHRDCGGRTEDASAVWPEESPAPYLASHADPYCLRSSGAKWHWDATFQQLTEALERSGLRAPVRIDRVSIQQRTASGRARTLALDGAGRRVRISASSLRFAIGRLFGFNRLPSDRYEVGTSGGRIVFDGSGSGHGVGLCQIGADQMGVEGYSYREILAFYYQGTSVGRAGPDAARLDWRRLAGERVALFTTQPDRDAPLLAAAERLLRATERRLGLSAPREVELRVYPDVAAFRDSTGEPGWVAARTAGHRIQMQPAAILQGRGALESTLRHELVHVVLEYQARPDLPVWFREGLAAYLAGPGSRSPGSVTAGSDADLRQTSEQDRARDAYEAARGQIARLVARYGEAEVIGWLRLGLPREVTNASSRQSPTNSR